MIPKNSTPIKNEILTNIFAKRLLSLEEISIVSYIIRWSWGFDGVERRQDWTKELTKKQIADDIEMNKGHLSININKMIKENIIIIKDNCYQFNEHYEDWKKLPKRKLYKKVTEKETISCRKGNYKLPKRKLKVTEKETLGIPNNSGDSIKNRDLEGDEHSFKETNKETNKETIKKREGVSLSLSKNIIDYLNIKTNKNYKYTTPLTIRLINARIKEKYSLEDFKKVIDIKTTEWKGKFTKDGKSMEDWLRPPTLFGNKFESYLNQSKNYKDSPKKIMGIDEALKRMEVKESE